jgi:hypothetical protein
MLRLSWLATAIVVPVTLGACGDPDDPSGDGGSSGGGASSGGSDGGAGPGSSGGDDPTTAGPGTQSASADSSGGETTGTPDDTGSGPTSGGPTSGPTGDVTGSSSGDPTGDITGDPSGDPTGDLPGVDCLAMQFINPDAPVIDYEQFDPVIGSHCKGTNHQEITDIERVVFLGDSVTVGTPPTGGEDFYRSKLADVLVDRFGLTPPGPLWKQANPIDGVALQKDSGDFSSCSKWGARTDDFKPGMGGQIDDCFPPDLFDKRTLVVYTMGGNDLAAIAKDGMNGKPIDELMLDAESAVQLQREAVHWFVDDPDKFPNGVFVVFANVYEFSDGTGDLMSCPAAPAAGFDKPYPNPEELKQLVIWVNEQFMEVAAETKTDMVFLTETFCGHGFRADDPTAPCYRGPDQDTWFDLTCIHPTPEGHQQITDLFTAVVDE